MLEKKKRKKKRKEIILCNCVLLESRKIYFQTLSESNALKIILRGTFTHVSVVFFLSSHYL